MTGGDSPLRLTDGDVSELIDAASALRAVERGLRAEAQGLAETLPKSVLRFEGGANSLHLLGAVSPSLGLAGVKSWLHAGPTAYPVLILFDSKTARCLAIIEATVLSNLRTAALTGVATGLLAAREADSLALIGSGKLASSMLDAIATIRNLQSVRIWSPTAANRDALAEAASRRLGLPTKAVATPAEALEGAPIVGMAARVAQPVFEPEMIATGAHINAIGVTVSGKSEIPAGLFPRCSFVCTDSLPAVRSLSDDFIGYYRSERDWDLVTPLSKVVTAAVTHGADWDLSLYKGMGTGVADIALGAEILLRAKARGDAVELPEALTDLEVGNA